MQDKLIEEVQGLVAEPKKKKSAGDFIKDEVPDPTHLHLLAGLSQKRHGEVYQGTVDKEIVRQRRAKNKRARAARRKNRK